MTPSSDVCLYCERNSNQIPLLALVFQGKEISICAQHLPVLIHSPAKLADKLPGLAQVPPAEHHHD
jgi:hypothetical protein